MALVSAWGNINENDSPVWGHYAVKCINKLPYELLFYSGAQSSLEPTFLNIIYPAKTTLIFNEIILKDDRLSYG